MRKFRTGLLALTCLSPAILSAQPAAAVDVRSWDHGDYGRLVFDWGRAVGYTLDVSNSRITVDFDQPVEGALGSVTDRLGAYVGAAEIAGDGTDVVLTLRRPVTVDDFVLGDRVVLDLRVAPEPAADPEPPPDAVPESVPLVEPTPVPEEEAAPPAEPASPRVVVSGGRHSGFSRIVFDWPASVDYEFERDGDRVTVAFDQAGDADLPSLRPGELPNVAGIVVAPGGGPLTVALDIDPGHRVRHYSDGRQVVIDVLDDDLGAGSGEAAAAAATPEADAPAAELAPAVGAPLPLVPVPAVAEGAAARDDEAADGNEDAPQAPGTEPAETAFKEQPVSVPSAAETVATAAEPDEAAELSASFDLGFPIFAAVFERAGHLWLTFASANRMDPSSLAVQGAGLGPVEIVEAEGGIALRVPLPADRSASVSRRDSLWTVTLSADPRPLARTLVVDPQPEYALGARLLVEAPGARGLVRLVDPEVGDVLIVAPLPDAGIGLDEERRFAQVTLLPSAQGLVAQPISEDITLRIDRDGVEITAQDGLLLSPPADRRAASDLPLPDNGERYLKIAEWQAEPGSFNRQRQDLMTRVTEADEDGQAQARLELGRFYFAHGQGAEALGLLDVLAAEDQDLADRPDFALLRGAARVLAGDLEGAREDLMHADLLVSPEASMWRGALAAREADWQAAADAFNRAGQLVGEEPPPFVQYLSLPAALAAVEVGDVKTASRRLATMAEATDGASDAWPAVAYATGRIEQVNGERDGAVAAYARAAGSDDRLFRTRAELALISLRLEEGGMDLQTAVERLEGLRFAWRGDALEHDILVRLGDVYWQDAQYREALETWERAIEGYPDLPASRTLEQERAERVAALFSTDALDAVPPIDAASLYEDYKALMPDGALGDRVMRNLAERLVEIDLLERAGNMLQQLVAGRLEGPEKVEVGARLAGIRLLDGKPQEALGALDESEQPDAADVPDTIRFERRLLRARSLSELGRVDEALDLLAGDRNRLADAARLDIAWRSQNWAEAAAALDRLVGPPPAPGEPIPEDQAEMVLNRGIALSLADDRAMLDELAARFGPPMAASPHADTFAMLTRPNAPLGPLADLASIRREVAEVDLFQDFLSGYRAATPAQALTN
ncbi:MAG TPA: tetratricopeptide repeat protein [Alphaproteobacteria bacterium]|nr:tetratricopeptide repeat protein [Alphaproteobacteria bacterium]